LDVEPGDLGDDGGSNDSVTGQALDAWRWWNKAGHLQFRGGRDRSWVSAQCLSEVLRGCLGDSRALQQM
jgi:hypothetical protein